MITDLKRIANIYTGFTIRESVSYLADGETRLLQSKDLPSNSHEINDITGLSLIDWRYDSDPQYLKQGSIVLLARGNPKAYVFRGNVSDKVTVGHIFVIINLKTAAVNPEYLAWFINKSSMAKEHFEINSTGSVLNMTSISTVRDLPVLIPSLAEQDGIIRRNQQTKHDIEVMKRMIELRQEYNHAYNEQLLSDIKNTQLESR